MYSLKTKKTRAFLCLYIEPIGWIPVTQNYDPNSPYQFPVKNTQVELFVADSVTIKPPLHGSVKLSSVDVSDQDQMVKWSEFKNRKIRKSIKMNGFGKRADKCLWRAISIQPGFAWPLDNRHATALQSAYSEPQ